MLDDTFSPSPKSLETSHFRVVAAVTAHTFSSSRAGKRRATSKSKALIRRNPTFVQPTYPQSPLKRCLVLNYSRVLSYEYQQYISAQQNLTIARIQILLSNQLRSFHNTVDRVSEAHNIFGHIDHPPHQPKAAQIQAIFLNKSKQHPPAISLHQCLKCSESMRSFMLTDLPFAPFAPADIQYPISISPPKRYAVHSSRTSK